MYNFNIKPDFDKLRTYWTDISDEQFQFEVRTFYDNGCQVLSEVFDQEQADAVTLKFQELLTKHDLSEHFENLFYLSITKHEEIQNSFIAINQSFESKQRAKELAKFFLLIKGTDIDKPIEFTAKSQTDTAPIKDQVVSRWIRSILIKALETKEFPLGLFGEAVTTEIFGHSRLNQKEPLNIQRLSDIQNIKVPKPTKSINKLLAELCLYLIPYLQTHTHLKAEPGVRFADSQLKFLYDFLIVFNLINDDRIDSDPQDYIGTVLRNYKKTYS